MTVRAEVEQHIVSGAVLGGICVDLPVRRRDLAGHLARFGPLRIANALGSDPNRHVITCELWTVTEGRLMLGGVDQHELIARWAGLVGGLAGAATGAGLEWFQGAMKGAPALAASARFGARRGFDDASVAAGKRARQLSRRLAPSPYHELFVSVPDVCLGDESTRYTLVLDMVTDNVYARAADRYNGYGYHKQMGDFDLSRPDAFHVLLSGLPVLSGSLGGISKAARASDGAAIARLNERWARPLLGGLHETWWCSSRLERRIGGAAASATGIRGAVDIQGSAISVPISGRHSIGADASSGALAFAFTGVSARLTHPFRLAARVTRR
jgi:hypothetical protein